MVIEVCLVIITSTLLGLVGFSLWAFFRLRQNLNVISIELTSLLKNLNQLAQIDLQGISVETTSLLSKLNHFVSNMNQKSQSLKFMLKPLGFFNAKQDDSPNNDESEETVPQLIKWIATSTVLIKGIRELIKNHGK